MCRYVDYPITDVLQMMGRAGRPQFDRTAKAVIMVHEPKKGFYKKFLYEPFPVESALHNQLTDHVNAEIVNGTIASAQDAVNYLTWTYFYRRLPQNPAFYGLEGNAGEAQIATHLSSLVEETLSTLEVCIMYLRVVSTHCSEAGFCPSDTLGCMSCKGIEDWLAAYTASMPAVD